MMHKEIKDDWIGAMCRLNKLEVLNPDIRRKRVKIIIDVED